MSRIGKCITFAAVTAVIFSAMINPAWAGRGNGNNGGNGGGGNDDGDKTSVVLTEAEIAGLVFMREEEKLARDVYLNLYDEWGLTVFQNISESEQKHTDAIEGLLEKYGIPDPVPEYEEGDDYRGIYEDKDLQALYDVLIADGLASPTAGLVVGATIEEKDIVDIQEKIDKADQADIISTYESLMCGSRNHLRAFMQNLSAAGEPYTPQFLDPEEFDAILEDALETDCSAY
jgi:hypothetical protein